MPDESNACRKIEPKDCYSDAEDYTFYLPAGEVRGKKGQPSDAFEEQLIGWTGPTDRYSYDCSPDWADAPRLLACRSFQGRRWSVSGRGRQEETGSKRAFPEDPAAFTNSGYKPRLMSKDWEEGFLFPVQSLIKMIGAALELGKAGKTGLVLVAGATKSAKTLLARGLVHTVLEGAVTRGVERLKAVERSKAANDPAEQPEIRRPHLVTFEDPIEKWFWKDSLTCHPSELSKKPLDYTPRQRGKDARSLQLALRDALRQTPTVFHIGEIRQQDEWQPTIEFAGTGHMVVATAHGGSLTETMVKLCRALHASTPAQRNYIADRLLGVIHVRTESELLQKALEEAQLPNVTKTARPPKQALVGSLWRNTPAGVHALTSGGFSSLLSADGNESNPNAAEYCLGECWWVRTQLKQLELTNPDFWSKRGIDKKIFEKSMVRTLMHRYLEAE
jgi:hypothetical protein